MIPMREWGRWSAALVSVTVCAVCAGLLLGAWPVLALPALGWVAFRIRGRQWREYEDEALIRALRISLKDQ